MSLSELRDKPSYVGGTVTKRDRQTARDTSSEHQTTNLGVRSSNLFGRASSGIYHANRTAIARKIQGPVGPAGWGGAGFSTGADS